MYDGIESEGDITTVSEGDTDDLLDSDEDIEFEYDEDDVEIEDLNMEQTHSKFQEFGMPGGRGNTGNNFILRG